MFKKIFCIIIFCSILVKTTDEKGVIESSSLINWQDPANLSMIKKIAKETKLDPITFDVQQDSLQQDSFHRHGYLVRRNDAVGTVIICHGYLGCKQDAISLKHLFPSYNVMAFDFRAHGKDADGQFSTLGRDEAFDVIGAVNFVKSDELMSDKPVIAFGFSMGAVAAIQAQGMDGTLFNAMILDCPYDSTDGAMRRGLEAKMQFTIMGKKFTIPGVDLLLCYIYHDYAQKITSFLFQSISSLDSTKVATKFVRVLPIESIKKITVPCFFIHCENDKKVPISAVESLYENKPGFKRLWITQGKRHFGSYSDNPEMYWYKVNKFLAKLPDVATRKQARVCDEQTR